jgi:quinol-cytochrome oxidoreductase complex cytochrome b subunit
VLQVLIRGGKDIGPATLSIFFAVHTAVIPAMLIILMAFHFWRVRKARGLVIPRKPDEDPDDRGESVPAIPHLIVRELVVALVLIAVVLVFSILFNAPLEAKANPGLSPNPTKAPWYFAGLQELLLHFHPVFAVLVIPAAVFGFLSVLPYLRYDVDSAGVWFVSDRGRNLTVISVGIGAILTPLAILANEHFLDVAVRQATVPTVITGGLVPFLLVAGFLAAFYRLLRKKYGANRNEAVQAIFVMLLTAFLILTATGIWFRGKGMALTLPG